MTDAAERLAARVSGLKREAEAAVAVGSKSGLDGILLELEALESAVLAAADIAIVRTVLDIAGRLIATGNLPAVERIYLSAIHALETHPQAALPDRFLPQYNLAALYELAGATGPRDQVHATLVARADALTDPIDDKTARVFFGLSTELMSAGHAEPACALFRHLQRHAISARLDPAVHFGILCGYSDALEAAGKVQDVPGVLERSLASFKRAPATRDQRLKLRFRMGRAARDAGDFAGAASWFGRAHKLVARTSPRGKDAGIIKHELAWALAKQGKHYTRAEGLLSCAAEIAAETSGADSADYAGALGQLARLADIRGQPERAISLYQDAFRAFKAAATPDSEEHAACLGDAGQIFLRLQRNADALDMFQRALRLRQSASHPNVESLAKANANVATAYFELGDLTEATRHFRIAVDLRLDTSTNRRQFASSKRGAGL